MRLESGSRLGPYEISGPIGAGGMGEVYRARDTRLGREVAIKVLPAELTNDRDRLARFEREARSSSALNHRNIVTIHDFTSQDDEAWLVMELIRGESLRDIISRGPLPLKKLLGIASGMADGLAAAHAAGLVHRDLKPENIMVTSDGTAKILDFGLVKNAPVAQETNAPTTPHVTATGVVLGTASYMSPEQARGEDVDFRTDQFSCGVILYEMATGKNSFRRASAMDTIAAILNDEPPPLDEPLGWIVERCLHKSRDERYGSTADLAHDLRRFRLGPAPLSPRKDKSVRATPWVLGAIIALLIAVLILRRPAAAPREPVQGSVSAPEVVDVDFGEVAPPIAISPDGRSLLISGRGADDTERLWLHDLASGTTRPVADNVFSAGWSDDGKAIAYFADGKLKTVPREGGPPRTVCDARPEGVPAWSGDTILFTQYSTGPGVPGIYRVSASGGTPIRFASLDASGVPWWATFLPDGKHFLYVANRPLPTGEIHHHLMIASLDGGSPKVVAPIDSRALFADGKLLYVRDGTLLAQPFDVDADRLTGEAKPIVENLHYFRSTGMAAFTVSNTGVLVWRSAQRPRRLVMMDRAGMVQQSIGTAVFDDDGRLSPEGNRYAVGIVDPKQGVSDVWIYDLAHQNAERLTFRTLDEKAPVWAPDGRSMFYRSDGGGPPDIFLWRFGDEYGSLLYHGPSVEEPQDISPDGKSLLFLDYNRGTGADLRLLPLEPLGQARPFVTTPFNEMSARFSPDGHWVVYASDASGRLEVYVRTFEQSTTTRISTDGGTKPRWRRDGKELFFLAPGGRLMSVPMSGGATAGPPRLLFQASNAVDVEPAADGLRFLVQIEERSSDPPLHLLINWPARLSSQR